jgi:diguanylate cyclase (GGDEF)-like protein/PAS domain S-box-containing protein
MTDPTIHATCAALGNIAPEDRLRVLTKAFEQSGEAILISDRNNRIVAVNAAFVELTGYSEAEVLGRNPHLLASGRTTGAEYAALWLALDKQDFWQGELWDRDKNGNVYPKQATISAIRDERGEIAHYLATFSDLTAQKATAEQIVHMAHHDPLTGLFNRHALQSQLERILAGARRDGSQVAVLLLDLDRFKDINDTLGHQVGDRLLVEMAQRLGNCVRASDVVARLGGDEFVVVLPDVENALSVAGVASKIRRSLADLYRIDEHSLYATPSIGVALFPIDGETPETLIRNADTAMYHAKSAGRNNFQFFTAAMNLLAMERLKLETALRQALENSTLTSTQFRLEYQPQLHLESGRIVGLEALARWHHPQMGQVPPAKFIPVAEETGLIQPLGDWVFWEACRQLRAFKDQGVEGVRMAVNLSAQQLRDEALPSIVIGALACYDLQPAELEIEITESTAMRNPAATIAVLRQLNDIGIVLAIDDFGTGYSSLAYLKDLPIHRLKLDRSFVQDIGQNKKSAAICSATIVIGHNLGLDLVAEGVETPEQRSFLHELGCDAMQGFLYSKPMPADQVAAFIIEHQRASAEAGR